MISDAVESYPVSLNSLNDRLFIMSQRGRGFSEKCGVSKLLPPPPKYLHVRIVPPLAMTIFKTHPLSNPF